MNAKEEAFLIKAGDYETGSGLTHADALEHVERAREWIDWARGWLEA